jgi:type II secretory pathway component PulM
MIRTLRILFLSRSLREMAMLAGLVLVLVLVWLSHFVNRASGFVHEARSVTLDLADQARWLASRDQIMQSADQAASRLDPSSSLNGIQLYAAVQGMATDAGLTNIRSGDTTDERSGQFAIHSVRFDVTRADWNSLWAFYSAIQQRSPYISIEECTVSADPANPSVLNLSLLVSSVEIAR